MKLLLFLCLLKLLFNYSQGQCGFTGVATLNPTPLQFPPNPNNIPCYWNISAPQGLEVQISILSLVTQQQFTLEFYDGDTTDHMTLNAPTDPLNIVSSRGNIIVRFQSNFAVPGFNILYFAVFQHSAAAVRLQNQKRNQPSECSFPNVCLPNFNRFDLPSTDIAYLPGCTFSQWFYLNKLCFSLFFNDYPYQDNSVCRRQVNSYERCVEGVDRKCSIGNKTTASSYFSPYMTSFQQRIVQSFVNMTTAIQPSYDSHCVRNTAGIDDNDNTMSSLIAHTLAAQQQLVDLPNICNFTNLRIKGRKMVRINRRMMSARNGRQFCRQYSSYQQVVINALTGVCNMSSLTTPYTIFPVLIDISLYAEKMFSLTTGLVEQFTLPACY
nr:uncharacterized protein LOC100186339 [Ciona intestinalis]|eukprot:XP_002126911.1 uncharacterized protein LOC100186339 [Ciona intestinalis]